MVPGGPHQSDGPVNTAVAADKADPAKIKCPHPSPQQLSKSCECLQLTAAHIAAGGNYNRRWAGYGWVGLRGQLTHGAWDMHTLLKLLAARSPTNHPTRKPSRLLR